jgi:hypothetical protein
MNTIRLIFRSLLTFTLLFGSSQLWAQTDSSNSTYIKARGNSKLCIHKRNDGWANGNPVHLYACKDGQVSWKTWIYEESTGYIRSAGNNSKCIHKKQGNWNNGNLLHLWDCKAGKPEFKSWDYDHSTGLLRARHNKSKCIHKKDGNWDNGNPLHLWSCADGHSGMKSWTLQLAPSTPPSRSDTAKTQDYRVAHFTPSRIPADLESWLNSRMQGHLLEAITRSESGTYTGIFRPLHNTRSYQYKATVVPEEHIGRALDSASKDEWSLVAMTSFDAGARGVQAVLFFRHRTTQRQ